MLSIRLLRGLYPRCRVILLTDEGSRMAVAGLLELVDECLVVESAEVEVGARSRDLKIRARSLIDGDFVQLDSDTLPIRPFAEVFEGSFDMAAALDRNHICPFPHFPRWFEESYRQLGWPFPTRRYFNSGVIFWKDNPRTRELARAWLQAWHEQRQQLGIHFDQPSFNHAIDQQQLEVAELDLRYNALVRASPWFGKDASILHFHVDQFGDVLGGGDLMGALLQRWQATGEIDWDLVEAARQSPYSWLSPPDHLGFLFRTGHYGRGLLLLWRKLWQAARKPAMFRDFLRDKLIRKNRAH